MYCPKCGAQVNESSSFCGKCGFSISKDTYSQQHQSTAESQSQQPTHSDFQPNYVPQPTFYPVKKKKKHIGLWITLALILIIISLVAAVFVISTLLKPKDLGVKYTTADYESALTKTGISINFKGMTGSDLEKYKEDFDGEKLNINDYSWEFSDYQQKQFSLTPSEATALLNEIAPSFWWFDDLQVNVLEDGTLEGSSKVDIARLKTDLYSDIADQIPIPLPDKINIYSKGDLSITDNVISADPEIFEVGVVGIPDKYMTDDSVNVMEEYFSRIYTVIPGLQIKSLNSDEDGNILFDGIIPQSVTVKPKS